MTDRRLADVMTALGVLVDLWGLFVLLSSVSYPPCMMPASGGTPSCGPVYDWAEAFQYWIVGTGLVLCGLLWRWWEDRSPRYAR